uniref:Kazal-like domain-containing protein n=1 Tax=Loa loa TaxID=7209 RepID=A0A1I7VJI4_LOALO
DEIVCLKPRICNNIRQPICDSNGHWHRNQCTFLHAQCIAAQRGQTLSLADEKWCSINDASRHCYRQCSANLTYEPICATTFVTYPNRCLFLNAKCRDKQLEQLYSGECRNCLALNCNETTGMNELDSNFVCDQAGNTKRKCEFEMLRCIYERKFGYNITAAYMGRCCPTEDTCEQSFDDKKQLKFEGPVCDSHNVTYSSRCLFEVHKCRAEKIAHLKLTLLNENGSCSATSAVNIEKLPQGIVVIIINISAIYLCYH